MTSNQHLEITPSNITSNGKLSYKNGQPTIQLLIGAQDRMIVPGSIRLCGKFTVVKKMNGANPIIPLETDEIRMNERLGVYSMIDTLSIFSQSSGQTIETINHHNRMMSSYLSVTQSQQDFSAQSYESALRFPNYKAQQLGVVTNTQGATASGGDSANSFCIPLVCGLFLGQEPIPLSSQWGVGGLNIEIQLAPDQQVLFSGDNTDTRLVDSFYELSDVRLICEVQRPAGADLARMKSVLSAFMNVVPAGHINNFKRDGLATLEFTNTDGSNAEIEQLVFTRAGMREPLEYNIDTLQRNADSGNETADAQVVRNYMNAVMSFAKIKRTSVEPSVFRNIDYSVDSSFSGAKTIVNGGAAFGVGVAYDSISDQGVDFSNAAFGVQLQLRLRTDHPNAIYLFIHSRQTVVSSGGSIQVLK